MKRANKPVIETIRVSFDVDVRRFQAAFGSKEARDMRLAFAQALVEQDIKVWKREARRSGGTFRARVSKQGGRK